MTAIRRLIPNLFTAGNLVGGILAILLTLTGKIHLAPYCILIAALFDFLDGFMARLLKVTSELGKQLDSLADMVTFGVAPGLMVFELLKINAHNNYLTETFIGYQDNTPFPIELNITGYFLEQTNYFSSHYLLPCIAFIIPIFALFRLAKFNIDTRQSDSFIGLPTPAMTLFFAVLPLLISSTYLNVVNGSLPLDSWQVDIAKFVMNPYFLITTTIVFSVLMVSEIPLFALKFKHFKWKGNEIRFIFLLLAVILLATLFFWAVPLIIILYVILSLINRPSKKTDKQIT